MLVRSTNGSCQGVPQIRELNLRSTLFGSRAEIAKLGRAMPFLKSPGWTTIDSHPSCHPLVSTHEALYSLLKLSVLAINNTALKFGQILALEAALPRLNELHLCANGIATFNQEQLMCLGVHNW